MEAENDICNIIIIVIVDNGRAGRPKIKSSSSSFLACNSNQVLAVSTETCQQFVAEAVKVMMTMIMSV